MLLLLRSTAATGFYGPANETSVAAVVLISHISSLLPQRQTRVIIASETDTRLTEAFFTCHYSQSLVNVMMKIELMGSYLIYNM